MSNIALVLAGGSGVRMGNDTPKQFLPLNGKPVILYSLLAFQNHPHIDSIFIVGPKNYLDKLSELKQPTYGLTKLKGVICGGESRKQSSFNGLVEIEKIAHKTDIVLIHDAARPLVSEKIISDNIIAAQQHGACATVIPVTDTIMVATETKTVSQIPPRNMLYAAQTPQSFQLNVILSAHRSLIDFKEVTDDAGLLVHKQIPVVLVDGDRKNIKLTTAEDLDLIKSYMNEE